MSKRTGGFIGQDGLNAPDQATGVTGTAGDGQVEVSFTAPSDVGGAAITAYNVVANDGSRASGFSASSYTGDSFSTNSQDTAPVDIKFKSDGSRMFILGIQNRSVYEYELSAPYDVTTATYTDAFSVATQATGGYGLFFKSDGMSFYISDLDSETIYQYNCSTAWDISTASYASKSFSVSSQSTDPRGLWFKPDGTKMYVGPSGTTDAIFQYSLSTAWDVSTASYDSVSLDVTEQESFITAIGINSDGTKLYVIGNTDAVYEYLLPTAYVLTDGVYTGGNINISSQETTANGLAFNGSENKFYINGLGSDTVFEYNFGVYPTASPVTVYGLTNGTSYTFNVWAINPFGWSSPSDASGSVSPLAPRGIFAGGFISGSGGSNVMDYITISSAGNASDFGDLSATLYNHGGFSSSTRGITAGGVATAGDSTTNAIEYVTIATAGNSSDFGDLLNTIYGLTGCANNTRGLLLGGYTAPYLQDLIQYVTIATTGNATDFGNLLSARRYLCGALASPTRSVTSGGEGAGNAQSNVIQYFTIASTGNATDFGDLSSVASTGSSSCNSTVGLISLGNGGGGIVNTVESITIASASNSSDFGDLTSARKYTGSTSGGDRAVVGGGENSGAINTIDYMTITSAGNATDFGDLTVARGRSSTMSNAHGGLS